jgi:hypothetical protein
MTSRNGAPAPSDRKAVTDEANTMNQTIEAVSAAIGIVMLAALAFAAPFYIL